MLFPFSNFMFYIFQKNRVLYQTDLTGINSYKASLLIGDEVCGFTARVENHHHYLFINPNNLESIIFQQQT